MKAGLYRRDERGDWQLVSEHELIVDPSPTGSAQHAFFAPEVQRQAGDMLLYLTEGPDGHNYLLPWPAWWPRRTQ